MLLSEALLFSQTAKQIEFVQQFFASKIFVQCTIFSPIIWTKWDLGREGYKNKNMEKLVDYSESEAISIRDTSIYLSMEGLLSIRELEAHCA